MTETPCCRGPARQPGMIMTRPTFGTLSSLSWVRGGLEICPGGANEPFYASLACLDLADGLWYEGKGGSPVATQLVDLVDELLTQEKRASLRAKGCAAVLVRITCSPRPLTEQEVEAGCGRVLGPPLLPPPL